MRPLLRHSSSAIGIVAVVVFPYFWMLLYTRSSGSPSAFCTASLMGRLAWCDDEQVDVPHREVLLRRAAVHLRDVTPLADLLLVDERPVREPDPWACTGP